MTIFLHSLWRSSSTYIASKFRSPEHNTYWYYEPYNAVLSKISKERAQSYDHTSWNSGHTPLDQAYFYEYIPLLKAGGGVKGYHRDFADKGYFPNTATLPDAEREYLNYLQDYAGLQGKIPVFAFCRSLGRVGHLRGLLEGVHITQYRNPHNVLASCYKTKAYRQVIATIKATPPNSLPHLLGFLCSNNAKSGEENPWPPVLSDSLDSMFSREFLSLFFEFYIISNVSAIFYSDIFLDVDRLASDQEYRLGIEKKCIK